MRKEGKDTSVMRATTPDQHQQKLQHNAGGGTDATRMTMPAQQSHNCIFFVIIVGIMLP
jgi:hypothetical protein